MKSRSVVLAAALVVALATTIAVSPRTGAIMPTVDRIDTSSRFIAAVALSIIGFAHGANVVYVVNGTSETDALLAAPAAAHESAPVLLTNEQNLPEATAKEIARLHPKGIVIVGSATAVGAVVAQSLGLLAQTVIRVTGSNAAALSRNLTSRAFASTADLAYVATVSVFSELLVASAAAARARAPLVIVDRGGSTLDAVTRDLLTSKHIKHVNIVGDTTAVTLPTEQELRSFSKTTRITGLTPEALSVVAAAPANRVLMAATAADPSALALPALAGRLKLPLYLVASSCIDPATLGALAARDTRRITLVGSEHSLDSGVAALKSCDPAGMTATSTTPPAESPSAKLHPVSPRAAPVPAISPAPARSTSPVGNLPAISNANLRFGIVNDGGPTASASIDATSRLVRESPSLLEFYADFTGAAPLAKVEAAVSRGATPVITWEPRSWTLSDDAQSAYRLDRISAGDFDTYVAQYAHALATWGKPVMLRWGHEMNGNWYPWSEVKNGNSAGDYVAAWRHVHDIFAFVGATNVQWVWSPNVPSGMPITFGEVYPGASYVDVVALDGYNWGKTAATSSWLTPTQLFSTGLAQVRSIAPGKPIIIAETASTEIGGSKSTWNSQLVAFLDQQSDVDGIIWFDLNKETDLRINSSTASASALAIALAARK
jgi:putative cell wall-binding protein